MFKRNLIIIAIATLALLLTSNAFGQRKNRRTKANKPTTSSNGLQKTQVKKPAKLITEIEFPVKAPTTSTRPKVKGQGPDPDKQSNSAKTNGYIGETEKNVKKPSNRQSRSRQTNQTNAVPNNNLVTIPTDYPNVRTKKPRTFIGGSDDGQSIRRKQPRGKNRN